MPAPSYVWAKRVASGSSAESSDHDDGRSPSPGTRARFGARRQRAQDASADEWTDADTHPRRDSLTTPSGAEGATAHRGSEGDGFASAPISPEVAMRRGSDCSSIGSPGSIDGMQLPDGDTAEGRGVHSRANTLQNEVLGSPNAPDSLVRSPFPMPGLPGVPGALRRTLSRSGNLLPARASLRDLQLYERACGHEGKYVPMIIEKLYSALGVIVARRPILTIIFSVLLVASLSSGLFFARFETEPEKLYVPQYSEVGLQRKFVDETFGQRPQPGIFVVKAHVDGSSVVSREHMEALFDLHENVTSMAVPWDGQAMSFEDLCARRYFVQAQGEECLSSSVLMLWNFNRAVFRMDEQWHTTVLDAWRGSKVDFGGELRIELDQNGTEYLFAEALQISYYFNTSVPAYSDGGMAVWEEELVQDVVRGFNSRSELALSYWSTKLNERDASSIVKKDIDVLCLTFSSILVYVCITLGGFTLDRRKSRAALGAFCGICTVCSLASGFGICAYIGVPLASVSTLVLFTLIGVSVDDMIIIVDAFDRTSSQVSLEERVRLALSHAGTAITMTSMTTMVAFLSGVMVDLPSIQLVCAPAAASMLMVNVLQVTFFTALLVLDARRQASGELDCARCLPEKLCVPKGTTAVHPPADNHSKPQGNGNGAPANGATSIYGPPTNPLGVAEDEVGCTNSRLGRWWRHNYADWLMRTRVRIAVLIGFGITVIAAVCLIPHIQLGLPMESTLPSDSVALHFFNDVNRYWTGTQDFQVMLVLRDTELTDANAVNDVVSAVAEIAALPFILDVVTNWMEDYREWYNCTLVRETGVPLASGALADFSRVREFLDDSTVRFCLYEDEGEGGYDEPDLNGTASDGLAASGEEPPAAGGADAAAKGADAAEASSSRRHGSRHHRHGRNLLSRELRERHSRPPHRAHGGHETQALGSTADAADVTSSSPPEEEAAAAEEEPHESRRQRKRRSKPCVDANSHFTRLSGGHSCTEAKPHCAEGMRGWHIVRSYCPLTCELCTPEPRPGGNGTVAGLNASDAFEEEEEAEPPIAHGGRGFKSDVVLREGTASVYASRFILTASMPKVILEAYPQYLAINEVLQRHHINGFIYHYRYEFGVCDHMMPRLCLRNLICAAIGIFFSVWVFLPLRLSILSTLTVAFIDVLLLGVMVLYGVRLHCMTTVALLIALGLAIDYSCHLAHAYETSPLPSQIDKVKHACSTMGLSILNAGASTLLGTFFLAFSQTPVFRTVFVLIWNTVFFGLAAGLMVVPVVLSICGGGTATKKRAAKLFSLVEETAKPQPPGEPAGSSNAVSRRVTGGTNVPMA